MKKKKRVFVASITRMSPEHRDFVQAALRENESLTTFFRESALREAETRLRRKRPAGAIPRYRAISR